MINGVGEKKKQSLYSFFVHFWLMFSANIFGLDYLINLNQFQV